MEVETNLTLDSPEGGGTSISWIEVGQIDHGKRLKLNTILRKGHGKWMQMTTYHISKNILDLSNLISSIQSGSSIQSISWVSTMML